MRAARRLLRHEWQPNSATAQEIETAVTELLSDPAQAALAEWQIDTTPESRLGTDLLRREISEPESVARGIKAKVTWHNTCPKPHCPMIGK